MANPCGLRQTADYACTLRSVAGRLLRVTRYTAWPTSCHLGLGLNSAECRQAPPGAEGVSYDYRIVDFVLGRSAAYGLTAD